MKFGGIGIPELIIILVVVLLIFGPKNLPKLGSALGKTMRNLRSGMKDGEREDEPEAEADAVDSDDDDSPEPARIEAPKKKVARKAAEPVLEEDVA